MTDLTDVVVHIMRGDEVVKSVRPRTAYVSLGRVNINVNESDLDAETWVCEYCGETWPNEFACPSCDFPKGGK